MLMKMIPIRQLTKHRKFIIFLFIVVFIYSLQVCVFNNQNTPIEAELVEPTEEQNVTETAKTVDMTLPGNAIPDLTSLLGANIQYVASKEVNKCKFPDDASAGGINYVANITQLDLTIAEKSIFRNLTEKVRALTSQANDLLQHIMSERGLANPSRDLNVRRQKPVNAAQEVVKPQYEGQNVAKTTGGIDTGSHVYFPGGHWIPKTCAPKWKVAIIIPYRNRTENLHTLLRNLVPFLLHQELEFGIYIAEQGYSEVMNRGMMRNVGYQLAKHSGTKWDCYVFHDVDYVPMNATNYYGCDQFPKHYAIKLEEFKYDNPYVVDFGGVVGLTGAQMEHINGYSNMYWGWGGEDDDIHRRIRYKRFNVSRSDQGYYRDLPHKKKTHKESCNERFCLVRYALSRMTTDGLSAIRYDNTTLISFSTLYTSITVDASKEYWNYGHKRCVRHRGNDSNNAIAVICVMCYAGIMIVIFTCAFLGFAVKYPDEIPEGMDMEIWDATTGKRKKRGKRIYTNLPAREAV